jgi:hypothetical protein
MNGAPSVPEYAVPIPALGQKRLPVRNLTVFLNKRLGICVDAGGNLFNIFFSYKSSPESFAAIPALLTFENICGFHVVISDAGSSWPFLR